MSTTTVDGGAAYRTTGGDTSEAVKATVDDAKEKAAEFQRGKRKARAMKMAGYSNEEIREELEVELNLQNAIISVIVGGATAYAGLNVMSSIGESMGLTSGDMFYNASQSLEQGVNDFFTNLPTVFVVIALVLVIGYLTLLR
jgi:hypothetical protein